MSQAGRIPTCIGIIPDGNRRWAKANGLSSLEGHHAGYQKFKEVVHWAFERGVSTVIFYAFSTENWRREPKEVKYLMKMLEWVLSSEVDELHTEGIRVRVIGDIRSLSDRLQELVRKTEAKTKDNANGTVAILLSYGGRKEIMEALKKARLDPSLAAEESFAKLLWTEELPDPDLVLRTSGVKRLSNFLIWQTAYSELFFSDTLWPDFSRPEFEAVLAEFAERERRFGA
ncbi:MAG: di-trans,poly-cis-decaprenylcistransferase [Candidatus Sungbacteria bacterium]|uniref:Isoprenyl transferase n=1 Tax=Candidatus Sungiibacteriota bacterium TaxID=2750080 RepID=A0A9D6LTS8_9BACT|nr:di-trans,poly-cis-decaprenylcistransferase [Candidatus Sungbacteria bacterium]